MEISKSYKYRIYPNSAQENYLAQNFGAARVIWNALVYNFNNFGQDIYIDRLNETHIKQGFPWMSEVISYVLQQKRRDFQSFKTQYFSKKRKIKVGRPSFKRKHDRQSFRIPGQSLGFHKCLNYEDDLIKIPKMKPIKIKIDRKIQAEAKINSVTISKNQTGEYYASFSCSHEFETNVCKTGNGIGIDLGISHFITLSNGQKFENPKYLSKSQAKIKVAQKAMARKPKGSKRREKMRSRIAHLHQKVARSREWYFHNISNYLVKNFDSIAIESLSVSNMIKNRCLSKAISDCAWSKFISILKYKADWNGRDINEVNQFFASSKICSCCGHKREKLPLNIREWTCSSCNSSHDRDINAARNIHKETLTEELPVYSRREEISPTWFLNARTANFVETISHKTAK